jgi:hypothetical protein
MLDEHLRPSQEAEPILRAAGWTPERQVEVGEWVEALVHDGNTVFPTALEILRSYGRLALRSRGSGGSSRSALDMDPSSWFGERDQGVASIECITGTAACPIGEVYGVALLTALEDGRIVADHSGDVALLGPDWRTALDLIILGRGKYVLLARNYAPLAQDSTR